MRRTTDCGSSMLITAPLKTTERIAAEAVNEIAGVVAQHLGAQGELLV